MITARLNDIAAMDDETARTKMVKEVQNLVKELYKNHKSSHDKLATIREALEG
jgi:hypothetical protein